MTAPMAIIRLAREEDAAAMLAIYAPYVRDTAISFETEPPSEEEFRQRVRATLEVGLWILCEAGGSMLGYAYGGRRRQCKGVRSGAAASRPASHSCALRGWNYLDHGCDGLRSSSSCRSAATSPFNAAISRSCAWIAATAMLA